MPSLSKSKGYPLPVFSEAQNLPTDLRAFRSCEPANTARMHESPLGLGASSVLPRPDAMNVKGAE